MKEERQCECEPNCRSSPWSGQAHCCFVPLAVIFTLRVQTAYAQSPYVEITVVGKQVRPGDYLEVGVLFKSLPCVQYTDGDNHPDGKCDYRDSFPNVSYQFGLFSGGSAAERKLWRARSGHRQDSWRKLSSLENARSYCSPHRSELSCRLLHSQTHGNVRRRADPLTDSEDFEVSRVNADANADANANA